MYGRSEARKGLERGVGKKVVMQIAAGFFFGVFFWFFLVFFGFFGFFGFSLFLYD